jgi:hypothetical protein
MTSITCIREQDVVDIAASGRWPDGAPQDLVSHAAGCEVCRDLAAVVAAIVADRDLELPPLPAATQVWGRAQMRARQEAAAAAGQPLTLAQGVAVASTIGLAAAAIAFGWGEVTWPVTRAVEIPAREVVSALAGATLDAVSRAVGTPQLVVAATFLGAALILMPVALYLVFAEE